MQRLDRWTRKARSIIAPLSVLIDTQQIRSTKQYMHACTMYARMKWTAVWKKWKADCATYGVKTIFELRVAIRVFTISDARTIICVFESRWTAGWAKKWRRRDDRHTKAGGNVAQLLDDERRQKLSLDSPTPSLALERITDIKRSHPQHYREYMRIWYSVKSKKSTTSKQSVGLFSRQHTDAEVNIDLSVIG